MSQTGEVKAAAVAEAVVEADWCLRKRLCEIAEECVRVCPAGGRGLAR